MTAADQNMNIKRVVYYSFRFYFLFFFCFVCRSFIFFTNPYQSLPGLILLSPPFQSPRQTASVQAVETETVNVTGTGIRWPPQAVTVTEETVRGSPTMEGLGGAGEATLTTQTIVGQEQGREGAMGAGEEGGNKVEVRMMYW